MSMRQQLRRAAGQALSPRFASRGKGRVLRWIAASGFRTRLWYLTRRSYVREQQAMLGGIAAYHAAEADRDRGSVYHLRRDIHRLEKGLSAPEMRATFAEGYIRDAVDTFAKVVADFSPERRAEVGPTILWAADVLDHYFETVVPTSATSSAHRTFVLVDPRDQRDGSRLPKPKQSGVAPVGYDALLDLARRRRSVRAFLPEPVPREVIDAAIEVARQSPSACNRQAFEFRVFDEQDLVERIVDLAPGFDPQGRKVPCMVAVVGKYRAYFSERDMHVIYVDASLAVMGLVYAVETLGYASCCINWPSLPARDVAMARFLGLDADERVVMLLAIGRADSAVSSPYSEKAPLHALRRYNCP